MPNDIAKMRGDMKQRKILQGFKPHTLGLNHIIRALQKEASAVFVLFYYESIMG